jgi:acyl transferase domain-containing protein
MSGAPERFATLSPLQRAYLAVEEMKAKVEALERARTEPIAIVGIGCRFPGGANSPDAFWKLLRDGADVITEVPKDRWDIDAYYDPDSSKAGTMSTRWGGFLDRVDGFDAGFFGISPREATLMDPQQRLLLEVAWEALENAGIPADKLAGSRTGVFAGIYNTDYAQLQDQDDIYAALGSSLGVAPGRLSYSFDLQGPSMLVDTLCSSSLVAVWLACQSLRLGECNLALAGGVNLIVSPLGTIVMSRLQALAPDGRCKAFDARANGFVRSEGCGIVALKRLSDALADGDSIWAVIRGGAVNHDGRSTGLTAPNVLAQQAVLRQALAESGITPDDVGLIEAHGTGTALGDPIEIEALRAVYGQPRTNGRTCFVSSIKTNLGHAEAAAGIAGLIKATLALRHRAIPPHLHLKALNPRIDLAGTPFTIPTSEQPWPEGARAAAVSAFGLSGTNAHVILEAAPASRTPEPPTRGMYVLPISARSERALVDLSSAYSNVLAESSDIGAICSAAAVRRSHFDCRSAVVGTSAEELRTALATAARSTLAPGQRPRVGFIFAGHGSQYVRMARQLFDRETVFRQTIESCDRAVRSRAGWSLIDAVIGNAEDWVDRIGRVQPALFSVQVALAALWRAWGLRPDAVIGHSMGEVAAAHVAGILSLDQAAQIICTRSDLLGRISRRGMMLLVNLSLQEAEAAIAARSGVSIAANNGPRTTVVAGDADALAGLAAEMQTRGVFCRQVHVDAASHTHHVDPLVPAFEQALSGLRASPATVPFYSSVTGALKGGDGCDAHYWMANLRQPVLFWQGLQAIVASGCQLFVELSPHPVLAASIADGVTVLPSLRRGEDDERAILETFAALYTGGQPMKWSALYPESASTAGLPTYPWQRERFWIEKQSDRTSGIGRRAVLGERREFSGSPGTHLWDVDLSVETSPYLADHKIEGTTVVPAALYIALAQQAAEKLLGEAVAVENVRFLRMLALPAQVQLVIDQNASTFQFASQTGTDWTVHAAGVIRRGASEPPDRVNLTAVRARCPDRVRGAAFYQAFAAAGLEYGPAFQGVHEIFRGNGEALARIETPLANGGLHPALIDMCLQVFGAAMSQDTDGVHVPVSARFVRTCWRPALELWVHARAADGDISVVDENGDPLIEIRGFGVQRLEPAQQDVADWMYHTVWRRQDRQESPDRTSRWWQLIGDDGRLRAALIARGERCDETADGIVYFATRSAQESCIDILRLVQSTEARHAPRLWLVTRGAQATSAADRIDSPELATIWGLARTVALEHPEFRCSCIDLDAVPGDGDMSELAAEICSSGPEDQVAFRNRERYVARLARWSPESQMPELVPAGDRAFRLEIDDPGILENLKFRATRRRRPLAGEIEIEVKAAGLNFLDVLTVMGLRPPAEADPGLVLGGECAGVVTEVGDGVRTVVPGDAVIAIAPHALGRFVTTRAEFAIAKPAHLSFEEAAGLPVIYMTAWHALFDVGRLQAGERVLIHSGATGTGLAAVKLAQQAGAEVIATAGSPEKRAFLQSLGVRHVMNSRTADFAHEVMEHTGGQGVDVVLNSLAGQAIDLSLSVLAPYGRFLEIGKKDIYQDYRLGLRAFRNSLSYSAVDLAGLVWRRPQQAAALLRTVVRQFDERRQHPMPVTTFAAADVVNAFHTMAQAKHTGKIVVSFSGPDDVPIEPPKTEIRADGTYLITGGLGSLGLAVASWLVENGCRHLVLAGRREPDSATAATIQHLRDAGAEVVVSRTDVARKADVAGMLARIDATMPPLCGVFHAAVVLEDATIARLTPASLETVFAPKISGAWNLHMLTADRALDAFVLFSSAASVVGSPGQAAYTAANAYLDALAHFRHSRGQPALSINWGPWSEIGLAASGNRGARMAAIGIMSIPPKQGLDALGRLLGAGAAQVAVMPFNVRRWREMVPAAAEMPLFSELVDRRESDGQASSKFRAELLPAAPGDRRSMLEEHLREQVAQVLRTSPSRISAATPFNSMGLDSLMGLELRNRLELSLGVGLPVTLVWSHPTIAALTPHLAAKMGVSLEEELKPAADETPAIDAELEDLSEAEAAALLSEKLAALESGLLS